MLNIFESINVRNIFFRGETFSGEHIRASVNDLAAYLISKANPNSPFMYLFAHNHLKTVIAYFAIIRAGFIVVLVNPHIKRLELHEMLIDAPPTALIRINKYQLKFEYEKEITFCEDVRYVKNNHDLDDVCTLVYTAADDGYAKAAMLTKKNILTNAHALVKDGETNERNVFCALLPFYHMFGLQTGVFVPMMTKGSLLIEDISDLRRLATIADEIKSYKVSNIYSLPILYYLFGVVPEITEQLNYVNSFVSGGYKLPLPIFQRFLEKIGKEIQEGYGLTEASPVCSWHRPGEKIKTESVGKAIRCCDIKILNMQDTECSVGEIGEICIKGHNVMKGYYNQKELTLQTMQNGWLHTGDLGAMDEEGYVYVSGLKKRMLNVGGRNVYPAEVERFIKQYQHVEHVEVYRGTSKLQGDVVKAQIKLRDHTENAENAFKQWCLEHISHYKIPKTIEFY